MIDYDGNIEDEFNGDDDDDFEGDDDDGFKGDDDDDEWKGDTRCRPLSGSGI